MPLYAFQLGRSPLLGQAELHAIFRKPPITSDDLIVIYELPAFDAQAFLDQLGGVIRIMEVERISQDVVLWHWQNMVRDYSQEAGRKISFGISQFGGSLGFSQELALLLKKSLKEEKLSLRAIMKPEMILPAATVLHNDLLSDGMELVSMQVVGQYFAGKTVAIQQIDEYTLRDMERPARDMKRGMLPPKLAQVMLNIAQVPSGGTVLDPFCGTGTLLMESMLQGYKTLGSDDDATAVRDSLQNIAWLQSTFTRAKSIPFEVKPCDARTLRTCWTEPINAIVTEGSLGPLLEHAVGRAHMQQIHDSLLDLYQRFFKAASSVLKKNGTLVMSVPFFRVKETRIIIPEPVFKKVLPADLQVSPILKNHDYLLYDRPDQFVGRQIWCLKKI